MKIFRPVLLMFLTGMLAFQQFPALCQENQALKPDYKLYDMVLSRYVSADGLVDYKNLCADKEFQAVLQAMSLVHPGNSWTRDEQTAFWINLYNMYTLKLICDNPTVKSIKDIPGAWDNKNIRIQKQTYSLNQIEHEILRKKFNDPRIHFAINCASISCPSLQPRAFFPATLSRSLQKVTMDFINDQEINRITAKSAVLSPIFDWYRDDFTRNGTLTDFINQYSTVQMNRDAVITFSEYNWGLNSK